MSIANQITRINNNIANAYSACSAKGATMPPAQNSANLANCISSISGGGGGGSVTDYLKQSRISMNTGVVTEYDPEMGYETQTLNLVMEDYDDALFNITGKHFNNTSYDASTGTWTSNDGTLTLIVFKDYLILDSRSVETEWGTDKFFERPIVFALYGYFQYYTPEVATETEVLGIYLSNDSYNIPTGTSLCIGVSELYEEMGDDAGGI
jgi:hypothetical protein